MRKSTGSKFLIMCQWRKVINDAIPRLDSPVSAELLETEIHRARLGGLISDAEYMDFKNRICEVYKDNIWGNPQF